MGPWSCPSSAIPWLTALCLLLSPPLAQGGQPKGHGATATITPRVTPWEAQAPEIDWPRWNRDRSGMTSISSWYGRVETGSREDSRRHKGAFAVGNGLAFGMVGLSSPLNTLFNHGGPTYQLAENFFGEVSLTLTQGPGERPFVEEWAYRYKGTGIIGTHGVTAEGLSLSTVDLAPLGPGFEAAAPAILRILILKNNGDSALTDVGIRASLFFDREESPQFQGDSLVQVRGERHAYMQLKALESGANIEVEEGGALHLNVGSLGPGEERIMALGLSYHQGPNQAQADATIEGMTANIDDTLNATIAAWDTKLRDGATLHSLNARLDDLYEGMIVALLTQRSADGPVSPMNRYTKSWLRDTIGPLRLFARTGRLEDAQAMLDYLYYAAQYYGEIRNSYALGLPLQDLTLPSDPSSFWVNAPLMPGRNAAEAPSYLPLQYDFLYRHTGDTQWLQERYHYLKRAMVGQSVEADGRMPFSGDETFRLPLASALSLPRDPTDAAWSANSSIAYVAALDDLAALATAIGEDADALAFQAEADLRRSQTDALYRLDGGSYGPVIFFRDDTLHPYPFEDVATKPLFFGYSDPEDPAALEDVDALISHLMRRDGTLLTPDGIAGRLENPIYTGMVPGLFLASVGAVDHPEAPRAFDALALTASPSGMWQEMHWKDHTSAVATYSPSGRGASEVSARYRPWEGGENIDGMVAYLTGADLNLPGGALSLSPRLPQWLDTYVFEGLPLGPEGQYTLEVERIPAPGSSGLWRITLTPQGQGAHTLDLTLLEPDSTWGGVTVTGEPWSQTQESSPYPGQTRLTLTGVPLVEGETTVIEVPYFPR